MGGVIGVVCLALTGVFVLLKVTGRIKWSWLWVLAPLWAPLVLSVLAAFLLPIILKGQGG